LPAACSSICDESTSPVQHGFGHDNTLIPKSLQPFQFGNGFLAGLTHWVNAEQELLSLAALYAEGNMLRYLDEMDGAPVHIIFMQNVKS